MSDALEQIDASTARIRSELARTTAELDRRLRAAIDLRGQLHRHAWVIFVAGGVLSLLASVTLARTVAR